MTLSHSRDPFCQFTTSQNLETFFDRHRRAVVHFGGVPTTAVYDRTKTVVRRHVGRAGESVVLVWDGLSAHWSRAMRAWAADQDWLTLERLTAYAPELNPVELLWSALKARELTNLAGDPVADAAERGIHRVCSNNQLPWSFLNHTGLTIHPKHPQN